MKKFAFVVHPIAAKDAAARFPIMKYLPDGLIESMLAKKSPGIMSHITGVKSITGQEAEGWFIGLPMTPRMMTKPENLEFAYSRIVECAKIAEDLGAEIIGLGAFSSVVGDGGITVASRVKIAVTTGNSYTIATAVEGALLACAKLGIDPANSNLGVVGATGSIGKTCARMLAPQFASTILVGRDLERTQEVAEELPRASASTDARTLINAHVVITVSSAGKDIVFPEHLRPGAIVVDVARPRDVSVRVAKERPDVLVIEGGVVRVPGDVKFNLDFGFPEKTAYACMSETMMLALEGRMENFTLGKEVSVAQAEETLVLAKKHGFELSGFRSFEREVDQAAIDRAKAAAKIATSSGTPSPQLVP